MSLGKAAEATVASMRTPAQTVIAEPLRQRASSIRQDEPTVVAEPEPTEEVTVGQLSQMDRQRCRPSRFQRRLRGVATSPGLRP